MRGKMLCSIALFPLVIPWRCFMRGIYISFHYNHRFLFSCILIFGVVCVFNCCYTFFFSLSQSPIPLSGKKKANVRLFSSPAKLRLGTDSMSGTPLFKTLLAIAADSPAQDATAESAALPDSRRFTSADANATFVNEHRFVADNDEEPRRGSIDDLPDYVSEEAVLVDGRNADGNTNSTPLENLSTRPSNRSLSNNDFSTGNLLNVIREQLEIIHWLENERKILSQSVVNKEAHIESLTTQLVDERSFVYRDGLEAEILRLEVRLEETEIDRDRWMGIAYRQEWWMPEMDNKKTVIGDPRVEEFSEEPEVAEMGLLPEEVWMMVEATQDAKVGTREGAHQRRLDLQRIESEMHRKEQDVVREAERLIELAVLAPISEEANSVPLRRTIRFSVKDARARDAQSSSSPEAGLSNKEKSPIDPDEGVSKRKRKRQGEPMHEAADATPMPSPAIHEEHELDTTPTRKRQRRATKPTAPKRLRLPRACKKGARN